MAQQGVIIPTAATSTFPGCALSCATLLQAQNVCLPPSQPQSNQLTYDQCFCQSPFLTPFATTTDGVCVQECAILADRQELQAWYNTFCAQVRNGVDPTTLASTTSVVSGATAVPTTTVTATSGTVVATATSTGGAARPTSKNNNDQPWINTHWKWILLVGVLAIALAVFAWLAVWLKRRHNRKLDKKRAAASGFGYDPEKRPATDPKRSATPDLWGPHQMQQATKGYGYGTDEIVEDTSNNRSQSYRGAESSKQTDMDVIGIAEINKRMTSPRPSNRRARPSELEINARMIGAADRRSKSRNKSRRESPNTGDKALGADAEQSESERRTKEAVNDTEKT